MPDRELADAFFHREARRARNEAFDLLALVNPSGAAFSHLIADEFNRTGSFGDFTHLIQRAAEERRKEFFIDLGKLLEGKRVKPNTWSKIDEDVAFILCYDSKTKSTDAVKLLEQKGHQMSPSAFKQKRYNWRRAAIRTRKLWQQAGVQIRWNSFLDGDDLDDEIVKFV